MMDTFFLKRVLKSLFALNKTVNTRMIVYSPILTITLKKIVFAYLQVQNVMLIKKVFIFKFSQVQRRKVNLDLTLEDQNKVTENKLIIKLY